MSESNRFDSVFRPGLFDGQTAFVTGGGTGIGRCIAHELAALGATVVIAARRQEPLEATVAEIVEAGGKADWVRLNIREEDDVKEAVATTIAEHGPIDHLVNNAGGQFASPAAAMAIKGWRAVIDTNLNGTFLVTQQVFKQCMSRHGGAVVNIVADMWNGFPGMAHTGASRAGVVNLTKTLALEWSAAGVRINAVAPGLVLSSGMKTYPKAVIQTVRRLAKENPAGRAGTESEVSAAVVFLLSPAAAWINGETVRVDGAASLQKAPLLPMMAHKNPVAWDGFHLAADLPEGLGDS